MGGFWQIRGEERAESFQFFEAGLHKMIKIAGPFVDSLKFIFGLFHGIAGAQCGHLLCRAHVTQIGQAGAEQRCFRVFQSATPPTQLIFPIKAAITFQPVALPVDFVARVFEHGTSFGQVSQEAGTKGFYGVNG